MNVTRIVALGMLSVLGAAARDNGMLVVDRGLPQSNWNDASSIALRSNVRWTLYSEGFVGDDFAVGQPGERWVINSIRMWAVPGLSESGDPAALGDVYQDIRLYFGGSDADVSPIVSGRLAPGSNAVEGADIVVSEARNAPLYENFGANLKIYQVEFRNLNLSVEGGKKYNFGAWGLGRHTDKSTTKVYPWFTHASNSQLGDVKADGADGKLILFDAAGRFQENYDGNGVAWNKSSDLNVQVFASREIKLSDKAPNQ
jgi:hypothetical protein